MAPPHQSSREDLMLTCYSLAAVLFKEPHDSHGGRLYGTNLRHAQVDGEQYVHVFLFTFFSRERERDREREKKGWEKLTVHSGSRDEGGIRGDAEEWRTRLRPNQHSSADTKFRSRVLDGWQDRPGRCQCARTQSRWAAEEEVEGVLFRGPSIGRGRCYRLCMWGICS